ncbi:tRNA epoxyqueuosine(34) reductase QueG [Rubinisphaera margarita]|uniref:tRNA epoxyqueuosine(34) reductase QueG n=1 Tax=Rubinisphaera margarita TaxID=2909586 RepID=UPI001EE92C4B|nr:tRNA epoxyqueuosine(34) reductase QueG [Rubinisphaera margarita]MCG6156195.1 tRNA epoxyqueuosine(34) reductase QueG [Rubinisphaera margarita]
MSTPSETTAALKQASRDLGFDLVGIAPALTPVTLPRFEDWVEAGYAGEMHYIERRRGAYSHPRHVLPVVESVVMLGMCYDPGRTDNEQAAGSGSPGQIARYARGSRDYHDVIRDSLKQLAARLHELVPGSRTRAVVDTAPLLERDFARQAGLGWFGKNTLLLNKSLGSYLFLAALLTDAELVPDEPHETAHCGTCTRCLEACPTEAFVEPGLLDARRCIAYLTIELRDKPIPEELRSGIEDWLFGCDVCQEVCPWNRKAPAPQTGEFESLPDQPKAAEFLAMTPAAFKSRFRGTPLERTGRDTLARNAAVVLGNSGASEWSDALRRAAGDESPLVREASIWALTKLKGVEVAGFLRELRESEQDSLVLERLETSLQQLQEGEAAAVDPV